MSSPFVSNAEARRYVENHKQLKAQHKKLLEAAERARITLQDIRCDNVHALDDTMECIFDCANEADNECIKRAAGESEDDLTTAINEAKGG